MQDESKDWWDWLWIRIVYSFYLFIVVRVLYYLYHNAHSLFWGIVVVGGDSSSGQDDL